MIIQKQTKNKDMKITNMEEFFYERKNIIYQYGKLRE